MCNSPAPHLPGPGLPIDGRLAFAKLRLIPFMRALPPTAPRAERNAPSLPVRAAILFGGARLQSPLGFGRNLPCSQ